MDDYLSLLNLNFMYSLRTGNILLDMLIAMAIPFLVNLVHNIFDIYWPSLIRTITWKLSTHRTITIVPSTCFSDRDFIDPTEAPLLRESILLYMQRLEKPFYVNADYKYSMINLSGPSLMKSKTKEKNAALFAQAMREAFTVCTEPEEGDPVLLEKQRLLFFSEPPGGEHSSSASAAAGNGVARPTGGATASTAKNNGRESNNLCFVEEDSLFLYVSEGLRTVVRFLVPLCVREAPAQVWRRVFGRGRDDEPQNKKGSVESHAEQDDRDSVMLLAQKSLLLFKKRNAKKVRSSVVYILEPVIKAPSAGGGLGVTSKKDNAEDDDSDNDDAGVSADDPLATNKITCQRYVLSQNKTFRSLFFPEKQQLLQLIDQFEQRRGKFAIPGFPYKMIMLLYGPPGTGKTSLIKAIASYTKRHILTIPLARVRTNKMLNAYLNNKSCRVKKQVRGGGNGAHGEAPQETMDFKSDGQLMMQLPARKMIYVLEDVDAASDIVHSKSNEDGRNVVEMDVEPTTSSPANDVDAQETEEDKADGGTSSDDKTSEQEEKEETEEAEDDGKEQKQKDEKQQQQQKKKTKKVETVKIAQQQVEDGALSVKGLLQSFNGFLDHPGRMIILTTNHIEHIDPALLRPGVLTLKLHLGSFTPECAMEMIRHYYAYSGPHKKETMDAIYNIFAGGNTTQQQEAEAAAAAPRSGLQDSSESAAMLLDGLRRQRQEENEVYNCIRYTPAEVEQLCAEHNTIEGLLRELRRGKKAAVF